MDTDTHTFAFSPSLARSHARLGYITLQNNNVSDHTHIEHKPRTKTTTVAISAAAE